uniref:Uncharacterized protein n=1 Tax=Panagrolaimus davidi TaxID=227884 RepID=A0A914QFL6_9BILA
MPSLIPEILSDIGNELIENKDSNAINRFALSGKMPFQTMIKLFSSVETLEIHEMHYIIGWGAKCFRIDFEFTEPPLKFLLNCSGNLITRFYIKNYFSNAQQKMYQPIFDKIIAQKQLITFTISDDIYKCNTALFDEFLIHFSSTLKNLSIPSKCLTPKFRDSFNLESLTIVDFVDDRLLLFCCKTSSLTLTFDQSPLKKYKKFFLQNHRNGPSLFSINELILDYTNDCFCLLNFGCFENCMKFFPSIKLMKFNVSFKSLDNIQSIILYCTKFINGSIKVPTKVIIEFKRQKGAICLGYHRCKEICTDFETYESNSKFYCFRRIVLTAGNESTIFEVQLPKWNLRLI